MTESPLTQVMLLIAGTSLFLGYSSMFQPKPNVLFMIFGAAIGLLGLIPLVFRCLQRRK